MKYSTSYLSHNLLSQRVSAHLQLQMNAMVKENPNLLDKDAVFGTTDISGVEHYVTFANLVQMLNALKESKDFVIESDIVKHFYEKKHIKQNFNISMKIPFKKILITFEDPLPFKGGMPRKMEEYMNHTYDEWLRLVTQNPEHNIMEIDEKLFGILIMCDEEENKKRMEDSLDAQEKKPTMSKQFRDYYEKARPKTSFKVYFITDMIKTKRDYKDHPEHYSDDKKELMEKLLEGGFEYANILFDSALLPEFISEFEITKMNLYEKPINGVTRGITKLMNLTINLINFINSNETVEYAPIYKSNKQQKKYFQKTGKKLPPLFYLLKVKYPKEYIIGGVKGQPHSGYSYQFDVRGFFRYLKSPRYKNKRGQIIWINSFKKGRGVYIPKNYLVDSPKEVVDDYKWDEKTGE